MSSMWSICIISITTDRCILWGPEFATSNHQELAKQSEHTDFFQSTLLAHKHAMSFFINSGKTSLLACSSGIKKGKHNKSSSKNSFQKTSTETNPSMLLLSVLFMTIEGGKREVKQEPVLQSVWFKKKIGISQ